MSAEPMWRRIQRMLGADPARDADDEFALHIELKTDELIARGMSPGAARAEAHRLFGDLDRVRAEVSEVDLSFQRRNRLVEWASAFRMDLRYSGRVLVGNPAFTCAAVGTLALGIGAGAAVFSAVNSVLLKPLPYADPDRLVMLWEENPERDWKLQTAAPANMLDWREQVEAFDDVAGYADFSDRLTLTGQGDPRILNTYAVTGNFFQVLGVQPELGRSLTFEETWSNSSPVVVLSHTTWVRDFAGDPSIIGRTVDLDGDGYEVVAVLPEEFHLPGVSADAWRQTWWSPEDVTQPFFRRAHYIRPIARLADGVTLEQADAQLKTVAARLEAEYPETNRLMGAGLTPLHEFLIGDLDTPLLVLLAGVGVLLLLACANVGNLLLVRMVGRQQELAVRGALGAGGGRIVRQLVAESVLLTSVGAVLGLAIAWGALAFLGERGKGMLEARVDLALDIRFLVFIVAVILLASIGFALLTGSFNRADATARMLREGGRNGSAGQRARRAIGALVTGEIALALLLLTGALLLAQSFRHLRNVNPGFDDRGVFTAAIDVPDSRYPSDESVARLYDELRRKISELPHVTQVGAVRQLPLTSVSWTSDFSVEGRGPDQYGVDVVHREVTPGYFETLRVPLLRGRTLNDSDRAGTTPAIVVNEAFAEEHFPGADPLGQRVAYSRQPDSTSTWWTIVGVVGSERQAGPGMPPRAEVFNAVSQEVTRGMTLVVRTAGEPAALAEPVRQLVSSLDPELVLDQVRTLSEVREEATQRERFLAQLFAFLAVVALTLALVGVYGVMAQSIRSRRREIGIRVALGAQKRAVVSLLLRYSLMLLVSGIVGGLIATTLLSRGLSALLYGIAPRDPLTLGATAIVLLLSGLGAAAIPAVRASRAEPAEALQAD